MEDISKKYRYIQIKFHNPHPYISGHNFCFDTNKLQPTTQSSAQLRQRPIGMNQNLRIPILPTIKLGVSLWRLVNSDFVADNERRLSAPRDDHVAEVAVVGFYVALTGSDCKALFCYY
jgi:hypothetical protein